MKTKPLEEKLKKMNEGVLSVELVEASDGDLPVPVGESQGNIPTETKTDGNLQSEIAYLCHQAGIKKGYVSKLEGRLNKLLLEHDFIKEEEHYERVRPDFIDYLFLDNFGPYKEKMTVGFSVKMEDNSDFEKNLHSIYDMMKYAPDNDSPHYPLGGAMFGSVVGIIGGMILGGFFDNATVGFSTFFGCFGLGPVIGTYIVYNHNKGQEKIYKNFLEKYKDCLQASDKPYDFGIIKPFLELTPEPLEK